MSTRLTVAALVLLTGAIVLAQAPEERRSRVSLQPRVPETIQLLSKKIPEVSFQDVALIQVIDWLQNISGANVQVAWRVLKDAGLRDDTLVSLKAKNLPLSQILWMILREAGGTDLKLAYRASGSMIIISTEEDLGKEMVLKIYDMRDMLVGVLREEAPEMDPSQIMNQSSGGSGGGGGGSSGSGLFQNNRSNRQEAVTAGEQPELQKLIEIIRTSIEPDSWAERGGRGTINSINGALIVYNTPLVHQQIGGYVEETAIGE